MNRKRYVLGRLRNHAVVLFIAASVLPAGTAAGRVQLARFGHGGIVKVGNGEILGLAAQKHGGVIAVGYSGKKMLVVRLGKHGSHGRPFSAGNGVASAVVIQPDGKIVVAGTTAPSDNTPLAGDMVVKRFKATGSPDRSFGSGGTAHLAGAIANGLALGRHGTIVAAGSTPGSDGTPRVALARLRKNGKPDKSFGSQGFAVVDLGPFSEANAVVAQHDGKIVFAGDESPGLQVVNAVIGRVSSRGGLDGAFAHGGVYIYFHPFGGGASSFEAVTLASSGRVVAGGGDHQDSGNRALFVRLSSRGTPDGSFGAGGVLTTPSAQDSISGAMAGARGLAIGAGGEILAAGNYLDGGSSSAALWAIKSNGRLDDRQGHGGLVQTTLPGALGGEARAIAVGSDGSIYSGGDIIGLSAKHGFVARYSFTRHR